ncbi:MAG: DMT family transporter [Pseudomonadota bacterium]
MALISPALPGGTHVADRNLRGIFLMTVAMGVFVLNDTFTKTVSDTLPTGQIIALRGAIATLIMLPIVMSTCGIAAVARSYSRPILIRNVSEIVAVILFLSALFRLPLANVTAILQTLPLAMTAAAAIFLGERVGWRRWTAACIGLAGILLIIRPGTDAFSWRYVSALISVIFITARDLATRMISAETPTVAVTFLTAAVVTGAGCLLGTTEVWVWPDIDALLRLGAAAVLVLLGYALLIETWRGVEVSAVAPFRYAVVLWAMLFGYLFLGEVPSGWTILGSAIVVGAGLYTFHRERQRKTAAQSPAT